MNVNSSVCTNERNFSRNDQKYAITKKKNTMKTKKKLLSRTNLTCSSNRLHSLLMIFIDSFSQIVDSGCVATDFA